MNIRGHKTSINKLIVYNRYFEVIKKSLGSYINIRNTKKAVFHYVSFYDNYDDSITQSTIIYLRNQ